MSIKRYAAALGAAGLVFAAVYGAAASLAVDGGALQTGQASLACDGDGVQVGYLTENDDQTVRSVKVSGITDTCGGSDLLAAVLSGGAVAGQGEAVIPAGGGELTVPLNNPVPIAEADTVQITIES